MRPYDDDAIVLALLRRPCDERRLVAEGTYHIPITQSAALTDAQMMAWYVPAWHHETPWTVRYRGIIQDRWLTTRRLYLPDEPSHPRADAQYWVIRVRGLERLEPVLPSLRWRRVSVHRMSAAALLRAPELGHVGALSRRVPDKPVVWEW